MAEACRSSGSRRIHIQDAILYPSSNSGCGSTNRASTIGTCRGVDQLRAPTRWRPARSSTSTRLVLLIHGFWRSQTCRRSLCVARCTFRGLWRVADPEATHRTVSRRLGGSLTITPTQQERSRALVLHLGTAQPAVAVRPAEIFTQRIGTTSLVGAVAASAAPNSERRDPRIGIGRKAPRATRFLSRAFSAAPSGCNTGRQKRLAESITVAGPRADIIDGQERDVSMGGLIADVREMLQEQVEYRELLRADDEARSAAPLQAGDDGLRLGRVHAARQHGRVLGHLHADRARSRRRYRIPCLPSADCGCGISSRRHCASR